MRENRNNNISITPPPTALQPPRDKLWLFAATNSTIFVNNNNILQCARLSKLLADLPEIYFRYVVTFGSPESRRQLFCLNNCTATSPEKLEWEWKLIKQLPWTNQLHWAVTGHIWGWGQNVFMCWCWRQDDVLWGPWLVNILVFVWLIESHLLSSQSALHVQCPVPATSHHQTQEDAENTFIRTNTYSELFLILNS